MYGKGTSQVSNELAQTKPEVNERSRTKKILVADNAMRYAQSTSQSQAQSSTSPAYVT